MNTCITEMQLGLFDQGAALHSLPDENLQPKPRTPDSLPNCSEIQLSGQAEHCMHLLAPILRLLSEQDENRWLTLVSPPAQLTMHWLRQAGLNPARTLILHPRGLQSSQELACLALETGCSHTVVSWLPALAPAGQRKLSLAARSGSSQSINIRQSFQ